MTLALTISMVSENASRIVANNSSSLGITEIVLESEEVDCERLQVRSLRGFEEISKLFDFDLEVVSLDKEEDAGDVASQAAGARVTVKILRDGEPIRHIHGMVSEVEDRLKTEDLRVYRFRVVPRAFRLTLVETQDIFISKTIPEIVKHKLDLLGISGPDIALRLTATYPTREFVVQYNETDLAFISRLCEHVGIAFFFEHKDGRDVMVFTDHAAGFHDAESSATSSYRGRGERKGVFDLNVKTRVVPSIFVVRDYNYRHPQVDLTCSQSLGEGFAGGVIEFGTHYKSPEEGNQYAKIRAEEHRVQERVFTGTSDAPGFAAGAISKIEDHPILDTASLLFVRVEHVGTQVVAGSGAEGYENHFRAIPSDRTFRPARTTPKPKIPGLVTGIVDAGPQGTDTRAVLDDQGRYMVRFLFDTTAPGERFTSHPVRMVQQHVGEHYGTHFPLKPGVEVVVGFVNGDPDRPVIVGAVPTPLMRSPVDASDPTVHRIRTGSGITVDFMDNFGGPANKG